MTTDAYQQLLLDLDESLDAEGFLPLYTFSWWLRGQQRDLSEQEIAELCQRAYADVTQRHRLHLEWFDDPGAEPTRGRRAAPETEPDFDIDSRGQIDAPFLALVPND